MVIGIDSLRHASPAEIVLMGDQNTLLCIMQTVLRSQENVVLAVNKCDDRLGGMHGSGYRRCDDRYRR